MESFDHDGLHVRVHDLGPADGTTVVLLHGFPQQPSSFDQIGATLREAGLRTLIPTLRGYTAEARPRGRRQYSPARLCGDVLALLDAAGLARAHLVGHDWGGGVAWMVAAQQPERVASLTVLSTPHLAAFTRSWFTSSQGLRSWYVAFFQLPGLPERLTGGRLAATLRASGLPEGFVLDYAEAMAEPGALTAALNWYRGWPFGIRQGVGPIEVPTTYVWGRRDFALGRAAAERTERYVTGPYRFVELDAGHWLPETEPDTAAETIIDQVAG